MKRSIIIFLLIGSIAFCKEDYSEMSTQELIAIMGYVNEQNKSSFIKELNSRVPTMNTSEKNQYEKNKKKLENNEK